MERGNYDERRLYLAVQGAGRSGTPVLVEASAERTNSVQAKVGTDAVPRYSLTGVRL